MTDDPGGDEPIHPVHEPYGPVSRGVAPRVPDRVPVYAPPLRDEIRAAGLFDADGRPLVASAREVAPDEDNPLPTWIRLGERIAYQSLQGKSIWPLNVQNNVLLFYLAGRARSLDSGDLFALFYWAIVLAFEAVIHWIAYTSSLGGAFGDGLWFFSWFLLPIGAMAWTQYMTCIHVRQLAERIPVEELSLTRLDAREIIYGVLIRPLAVQHAANAFFALGSTTMALYRIAFEARRGFQGSRLFSWEADLIGYLFVSGTLVVARYWIIRGAVNMGAACAVRAAMDGPSATRLFWTMAIDLFKATALWACLTLGGLFATLVACCLGYPISLLLVYLFGRRASAEATRELFLAGVELERWRHRANP